MSSGGLNGVASWVSSAINTGTTEQMTHRQEIIKMPMGRRLILGVNEERRAGAWRRGAVAPPTDPDWSRVSIIGAHSTCVILR